MALYRVVHTGFWKDSKILEEMTPEDKFYFLYLLTNPNTTQIGIYNITKKQMAFELGYSIESINSLLDRFENHHRLVRYNSSTREIAIKNWGKHNLRNAGKPMLDCVKKELKEVKDTSLIEYVSDSMSKESIKSIFDNVVEERLDEEINYLDGGYDHALTSGRQKEKEKQKEIQKEKEIQIQKEVQKENIERKRGSCKEEATDDKKENEGTKYVGKFAKLYEKNIGMINGVAYEWICDISDHIDENLFKKAIEIATDRGKCNKGYVSGIIRQWISSNIRSLSDYEAFELGRNKGGDFGGDELKENEDEFIRRPTEEELEAVRKKWLN